MNIDLGNSGNFEDLSPMFLYQGSPYLSPLMGSLSPEQHASYEDIDDFRLEQEPFKSDGAQFQYENPLVEDDLLLGQQEQLSERVIEFQQPKIQKPEKPELQTPTYLAKPHNSKVYSIIQFLVQNSSLPQETLQSHARQLCHGQQKLEIIFKILLTKFKKLRKTKEQMIKYCMRKAFKYISEMKKPPKKVQNAKIQKTLPFLEMPFKKNSSEKTMNAQYLKQIFIQEEFLDGYHKFLNDISRVIEEDNAAKVQYLADMIEKMVDKNQLTNVQKIKRLPWSKSILDRTQQLAKQLLQFSESSSVELPKGAQNRKKYSVQRDDSLNQKQNDLSQL